MEQKFNVSEFVELLRSKTMEQLRVVADDCRDLFSDFVSQASLALTSLQSLDVDTFSSQDLVRLAKSNAAKGGNQVVVYKMAVDSGGFVVYVAYAKDRQLLPVESNRYVVVRANSLAPDVVTLFEDSNLVILK